METANLIDRNCAARAVEMVVGDRIGRRLELMNSPGQAGGRASQSLRDRVGVWQKLVERCGKKPTRKRVHALRVVTLRIQAEVEHEMGELPHASHQAQAMLRFGKQAQKLRAALGSVRELDVWIGKLQDLRGSLSKTTEYVPRSTRDTVRQIERLEERLTRRRWTAGQKLLAEIEKRRQDLMDAGDDLQQAASDREDEMHGNEAAAILKEFAAVAAEFPTFDEENLHDFRKRIKKVRYLAEICGGDPECGRIAAQMKKLQSAIGRWHDWQELARTASRGKHAKDVELKELLDSLAAEAFEAALAVCHGAMVRMDSFGTESVRKPVARSERYQPLHVKELA
jgi:CHAD domain-containing protein